MLYGHYQKINIAGDEMMMIKFSSDPVIIMSRIGNRDWENLNRIIAIFKQIPSGKRNYDPVQNIWTVPYDPFYTMVKSMTVNIYEYPDLIAEINKTNNPTRTNWSDQVRTSANFKAKVENVEDFFKNSIVSSSTLNESELKNKLKLLMLPYVNFELDDKESLMRGYKFAARRLHPDFNGGNGDKMSELNTLWSQYKEMVG